MRTPRLLLCLSLSLSLCMGSLTADARAASATGNGPHAMTGVKNIVLSNPAGEQVNIGTVTFADAGNAQSRFTVAIAPEFGEYFLAMRPFRCLAGKTQQLCWFPVNREPQVISATDLVPLEYALMFMRTKPASLHLNPFNGVYYKMAWSDEGLTGTVQDVDMDPFITPDAVPLERRVRPLRPQDLSPGDPRSHWLPTLTIR